jgi:hypothetical protein
LTARADVRPDSPAPPSRRSRLFLIAAAALAAGWGIALALLALFTANPVMLNREQILGSPYIVTGTAVAEPSSGRVSVEREWKKSALAGTITVENLARAGARKGITYIIPLSRPDDAFRVTEAPFAGGAPLIYPATPDAIQQLQAILGRQEVTHR